MEIILNMGWQLMRRCCIIIYSHLSYDGNLVKHSEIICAIVVEGLRKNICVKLFRI